MAISIPTKVQSRIIEGLKRFQPIVESAKIRDANESDLKITSEDIEKVLFNGVVKREINEGEESEDAKKKIAKSLRKKDKIKNEKSINTPSAESTISNELPTIPIE